jgi:N-acetylneuraminic acid mutarotase
MTDGVYVYGGLGRNASSVKKLFRYDPSLDTWTEITTYPGSGTIGLWSGYYNGVLIVGGGTDVIDIHGNFHSIYSECWKYNIAGNSWAPCASCPAGLCYSCSAVWADKLYVCGGHYLDGVPKKTLYRYNIVDDTWSTMTEITGLGRSYAAMAAGDGKLFCGGGNNHWSQAWYQTDFYIYDILSDTWAPMANWPDANCNHAPSQVYAGKLHCWGPSYKHYEYTI